MNRMQKFKEYIPITFAIFVTFILIVLGILSIIGLFPFNKKHKDVGIGMIVYAIGVSYFFNEGITNKTAVSLGIALILICVQLFWKNG